jgi:hypothetical protein
MIEAMGLKIIEALPPYQIHENLHRSSKVISGGHTERER